MAQYGSNCLTKAFDLLLNALGHLDWSPSRMIQWAAIVGPRTREVVETILAAFPHPEMGYRSCLGVIRLGQRYTANRAARLLGDLRGTLPDAIDDPDFAGSRRSVAQADRRRHHRRRHARYSLYRRQGTV
jgi:hypothetical protein